MMLPFSTALDVAYTGQHAYDTNAGVNLNAIDLGAAFLPATQNPALATSASSTDPATSYASTQSRSRPLLHGVRRHQPAAADRMAHLPLDSDLAEPAVPRRAAVRLQRHHRPVGQAERARCGCSTTPTARSPTRADQAKADELLGDNHPQAHLMRAQFVWKLPQLDSSRRRPRPRLHRERLEPVGHLVGRVGPGLQPSPPSTRTAAAT